MNDTGGGVTAIHDVPGDITRIGFHWMLLFFLSVTRRGFFCFVFTRSVSEVTGFFFVPNFRIFEFFSSHGLSRKVMDFFVPIFFLVPNLRICELFLHADCRGIIFFITNYRIIECLSHGLSRSVTDFLCHETCPWTH